MGAHQSKEELLYQQVSYGNVDGIKSLHREGAGLEWIDKEGKTPLIVACMRADLLQVAKTLIEMGANVNAYRPGSHAGTPLHHAAKKGLDSTVILLLSHGANPLVMNDDCKTPLDLARAKGYLNVVRAIETRICLFAGWLREICGPSILEAFAPHWVSKKIWAVVLPCDSRNPLNPRKFELALYPDLQVSHPRTQVALWKAQIEEPRFNQPDPSLIILDTTKKIRIKLLSAREGDKQQLQWLYNSCRGIYQPPQMQHNTVVPVPPPAVQPPAAQPPAAPPLPKPLQAACTTLPEDVELAMAINASIQTARVEGVPLSHVQQVASISATNGWASSSENSAANHGPNPKVGTSGWSDHPASAGYNGWDVEETTRPAQEAPPPVSAPSAPPISDEAIYGGPIHYPSIDSSPVDLPVPPFERDAISGSETKEDGGGGAAASSTCAICLDKPVEGACIPCGHMVGCMSCLQEINGKKGECPVCRAKIHQVLRLYAV